MNEPYFQVGEEVIVVSVSCPEFNGEYVIEDTLHPDQTFDPYCPRTPMRGGSWGYKLFGFVETKKGYSVWFDESSLRKKHKPSTQSFSNLITNIEPIEAIT